MIMKCTELFLVSCSFYFGFTPLLRYIILKSRKHRINTHEFLNCTHNILFYCYHTALNLYKLLVWRRCSFMYIILSLRIYLIVSFRTLQAIKFSINTFLFAKQFILFLNFFHHLHQLIHHFDEWEEGYVVNWA